MQKLNFALICTVILTLAGSVSGCSTPNPDGIVQGGVEAQMREKEKYTRACYDSEYKKAKPKPQGIVMMRITLNEEGDVKDVETLEDSFHNLRMANCLKYIVKSMRFDRAGVTMETFVEYPFIFKNNEEE